MVANTVSNNTMLVIVIIVASGAPMPCVNRPVSGTEMSVVVLAVGSTGIGSIGVGSTGVELPGSTTLIVILVFTAIV